MGYLLATELKMPVLIDLSGKPTRLESSSVRGIEKANQDYKRHQGMLFVPVEPGIWFALKINWKRNHDSVF